MQNGDGYHMSPEEFRRRGKQVIDWLADYFARIEEFPVLAQTKPGEVRASLSQSPPQRGERFEEMLDDVESFILPGITHWQSPNFFAFFPANSSGPSVLGELLAAGLGVQGMLWATSPACTELEAHVLDWVVELLDLPSRFRSTGSGGGVIQDSASSATLCALLAARERATNGVSNSEGLRQQLTVYASSQAHSSVEKAVRISGIGSQNLRQVPVDEQLSMRPDELEKLIESDSAQGLKPTAVVATVGTTSTMAMDALEGIGKVCSSRGIWLHVDAAMAGTAALCPEFRSIHDGLESADSYCFNPHKWMFTNVDCDAFYVADQEALVSALSILPEYLRNPASESGSVIDYRDWQIALGRRFRALKLWFVIRHYGIEGLQHHVRRHVELARLFASWVEESDRFELLRPQHLSLVCFRHKGGNDETMGTLTAVNDSGIYITHTKIDDVAWLRMSVAANGTELQHVQRAWELINRAADEAA